MAANRNDNIIGELIALRGSISEAEFKVRRARTATRAMKYASVAGPVLLIGMGIVTSFLYIHVDLGPYWTIVLAHSGVALLTIIVLTVWNSYDIDVLARRRVEGELERLFDKQTLLFSGEQLDLGVRQYAYRGAMQRNIVRTRLRGDRYRRVNNAFQAAIIVGSLATTTVASLNSGDGILKWLAVALSFAVGLSAGFTGYFKYRERAFYLRQTADDLEEQLNAYELGLPPYDSSSEAERIAKLTARMETIRVAQQHREQQLDQPKGSKDES